MGNGDFSNQLVRVKRTSADKLSRQSACFGNGRYFVGVSEGIHRWLRTIPMKTLLTTLLVAGLFCACNHVQQSDVARKEFLEYKTKAEQGAVDAQYMLGVCYYKG